MNISRDIFRTYDIRGIYGEDLTDEIAKIIGKASGQFFLQNNQKKVVVGMDNRISGPAVFESFCSGLLESGCDVLDAGLSQSPIVYYSWYGFDANASVMVTASHNPAKYNGFKMALNKKPLTGDDYQKIYELCNLGRFPKEPGTREKIDLWTKYKEEIKKNIKLQKKLKVVVDCANGASAAFAPELLTELGCEVIPIYCELDGRFPNHDPYPQKVEYYTELIKAVKEKGADAGLSFDGDGDRLGVYDEKGNFVENDRLAMIFSEDICLKNPNPKIVMNISTSLSVIEHIENCGGTFILWKTGYPNITEKMREENAIFGGEISGHFFFRDRYFGYDDALYAAFRTLEIISNSSEPLSLLIEKLPRYFETREIRVQVPEGKDKFAISNAAAEEIKNEFPEAKFYDFDGIRFDLGDGWGLIRPSNTEPVIGTRAEAKSMEKLEEIKDLIKNKLKKHEVNLSW
ncbi:phosphomannomutase/phosphoglucomutase [Candidatus Microgenomates bacterium]|jgi:phosphomannomutase/phosphoglucomutase|nr:MAG: phosphomannomutase/phosphoglucomutase [Candidatus Microgenomates bacterium]